MTTANDGQRVAFVTGASRGIGKAIALRLAEKGTRVALASRNEGLLGEVKSQIEQAGGSAIVKPLDVGDAEALAGAIDAVAQEFGQLDILVNNAGVTRDGLLLRMSDADFDDVMRIDLRSAFVACRAAARHMMRGRFGRIINIGSTSGLVGNAGQANYAAAKAGLIGLTRSIARELGGKGVTANVIAPGFVETDMTASLPQQVREVVLKTMALRRLGAPEDIAAAVAFLAGDDAGFITGQVLAVDGGLTMS